MLSRYLSYLLSVTLLLATATVRAAPDMSATEAAEAVQSGKVTLIDIRTPPEWKQTGVAKGAKLINMLHPQGPDGFANQLLSELKGDKNAPIALICRTGNRTTQMQQFLQAKGFTQVFNIKEGMAGSGAGPGWIKRGLPVETCTNLC